MEAAERAYSLLKELVKVDTSNLPGNETAACEVLARFLKEGGVESTLLEKEKGRGNLIARIPGTSDLAPILLSGHLDTVPSPEPDWAHAPTGAVEADGYLYGRGTIDVKNGVAMAASLLIEAKKRGGLKRPIILAAVADEETGCERGSKWLAQEHRSLIEAEYFLGEGGGMTQWAMGKKLVPIGVAEKGQLLVRATFDGPGGHASIPNADDASFRLGRFLAGLSGGLPIHVTEPAARFLRGLGDHLGGVTGSAVGLLTWTPAATLISPRLPKPTGPAIRAMLSNTASPTRISALGAANAIPRSIACELDVRTLPGFTKEQVIAELEAVSNGDGARFEVLQESPAVDSSADTAMLAHLMERVKAHVPDAQPLPYLIPGYTDAKWFSKVAKHCYGFCPVLNDDPAEAGRFRTMMHGVNERISKQAFLKSYALLEDTVLSFAQ